MDQIREFLARYNGRTRKLYEIYLNFLAGKDLEKMSVAELVEFFSGE